VCVFTDLAWISGDPDCNNSFDLGRGKGIQVRIPDMLQSVFQRELARRIQPDFLWRLRRSNNVKSSIGNKQSIMGSIWLYPRRQDHGSLDEQELSVIVPHRSNATKLPSNLKQQKDNEPFVFDTFADTSATDQVRLVSCAVEDEETKCQTPRV
jgi:hypothetical protein